MYVIRKGAGTRAVILGLGSRSLSSQMFTLAYVQ